MMNWLINALIDRLREIYLDPLIRTVKAQAAIIYLEGIKEARRIVVLICSLVFVVTLVGAGFVLIPLSLLAFQPWDPRTKAIVGVVVGAAYLLIPLVAVAIALSEKRWMILTGARNTLKKLQE